MQNLYTYELAKQFYRECQGLKLSGPMRDQFERALLSIVLNLAEGSGKPTKKDRVRFYFTAMGSLREIQALLDLLDHKPFLKKADHLGAILFKLIRNPGGR